MPPEMAAAMTGAPSAPVTKQSQQGSDSWMAALTKAVPATDNSMMSKRFYIELPQLDAQGNEILDEAGKPVDPKIVDKIAYWKPETPRQRDAYVVDLGQQRISSACLKAVFIRLLDENGNRVFTNEQQFQILLEKGDADVLETIGAHILNIATDDSESNAPSITETSVASEKEE